MTDELTGLSVFVEAVEAGGFSAAAVRFNLSRSAVGKTIARLEQRLGARLFHRTTRSQSLTEDGQIFYERCLRALQELRAGEAMLDSGRREAVGRLRVSMPVLFGRRCVAPILTRLAVRFPKLQLDLSFSDRLVDLIEDGFDLAIRNGALAESAGLTTRRVAYQRMTVCGAPSYLAAHGAPRALEELCDHDALSYTFRQYGRIFTWSFPREGQRPVEIAAKTRMRFDDIEAIADAAVAGLGLAWLPRWLIRDQLRSGALVELLADQPGLVIESHALWPQTPHLPLRLRLAIDALAAELPGAVEA